MGLRVLLHSAEGLRQLSVGSYVLGRGADCDVVVPSARASRKHARIVVTEQGAVLEDLSSANGTYVNGVRLEGPHTLAQDDFIVIGEAALEVTFESPSAPLQAPGPAAARHEASGFATDATVATGDGARADKWIEAWAERIRDQARMGQMPDDRTAQSAVRFGVELARQRRTPAWVDFVLELGGLGLPLPLARARSLEPVIDEIGVSKGALDACLEKQRTQPPSDEQRELLELLGTWRAKIRPSG